MKIVYKIKQKLKVSDNIFVKKFIRGIYYWHIDKVYRFFSVKPWMNDKKYISKTYYQRFGVLPDLEQPHNFNEKNNWRKLYDRQPIYTSMVDKYELKHIVLNRCGEGFAFPLLGVWNSPKEINFDILPRRFVLKANHCGGVIICRDRDAFNKKEAINELLRAQKINYYMASREWPYKNVERKIIAETYMGENLTDYKNYCFNGKLQYTFVWTNESREDGRKPQAFFCGAYDRNWEKSGIVIDYPSKIIDYPKPDGYEEMISIAEIMSKDIPFVRVDCYCIEGHPYIGEMTFFPWGGFEKFKNDEWNEKLGRMEKLPFEQ